MENLGALAILLAFCFSIYAIIGSLIGRWKRRPYLTVSGERAIYSVWALLTTAAGILVYSLIQGDFRLSYVAQHSNRAMPAIYKFTAWWGGQEGSLLFWSWLLSTYAAVLIFTNRRRFRDMMPYVVATISVVQTFFLILNGFVASPFKVLVQGGPSPIAVPDGNGLNPLLQYWAMAIHPPMLYLGYVGFAVPFAFAMGSLITRQPGEAWIHTTRRWTLVTWLFQTCGIVLGSGWAYSVLGWGGWWAWDPVENASLLPWITATAYLHSVMMQEKKGMMKIWNIVLVSCTFFLCIFGTFLTRSGVVSSVHAFAQSSIGTWFVSFLAIIIAATVYLIFQRLDYLKSEAKLESVISRESSFMFNNLILIASCFAVLWGTLFPVLTEWVMNEKITVGKPFYDRINIPIGLFLLFLTGVGPLVAWRRSSLESLKRAFLKPGVAGVALMVALFALGIHSPYALLSFGLCLFVALTILIEFYKGARAISGRDGSNLIAAMVALTHRNTRRYGGYIVHMGIVLMFIGFTGSAFNRDQTVEVLKGDRFRLGGYEVTVRDVVSGENENYLWQKALLDVSKNGSALGGMEPEKRLYKSSRQPTSEVSIRRRLNEDFYLNFAGPSTDSKRFVIQAYIFPLVSWIWIGVVVVLLGTFVCLVPSRVKLHFPKTEVVGVASKQYAPVEK